jgi:hypothetical protein
MTADNVQICCLGAEAVGDELGKTMQKRQREEKEPQRGRAEKDARSLCR